MDAIIDIWHNVSPDNRFRDYEPGQAMKLVHTYDVQHRGPEKNNTDLDLCEHAFSLFNAPEEFLYGRDREICEEYRSKRLRSLSVGDVVAVRRGLAWEAYCCCGVGWQRIPDAVL